MATEIYDAESGEFGRAFDDAEIREQLRLEDMAAAGSALGSRIDAVADRLTEMHERAAQQAQHRADLAARYSNG